MLLENASFNGQLLMTLAIQGYSRFPVCTLISLRSDSSALESYFKHRPPPCQWIALRLPSIFHPSSIRVAAGFLGVDMKDGKDGSIILTQTGLTERIIDALGLHASCSTKIDTPAEPSPLPKDSNGIPADPTVNYASVIGMLLYLAGHSRPDIAFAVHQCARNTFQPTRKHVNALKRIGRYLKGTRNKGIIMCPMSKLQVVCYPDADFAGLYNHEDSQDPHCVRSRTGYVILLAGCPVLWKSKLQTKIALSTMEAEYVALSQSCKDLFPLLDQIKELGNAVGLPVSECTNLHTTIYKDNVGALTLSRLEPKCMTPRSKHYAIKYHWFREQIGPRNIILMKVDTQNLSLIHI